MKLQNIANIGSNIYLFCREQDNSLKIIENKKFLPYYYEKTTDKKADAVSIYKEPLMKIYCNKPSDIRKQRSQDAYEADVQYTKRYILDKIDNIIKSNTRIIFFDIEVQCQELPHPKEDQRAESPISVITVYDNYTAKYTTFYIKDYESEFEMLEDFCQTIKKLQPDILTAYNVDFDYYYLFYRIGENFPQKISPISQTQWERGFQYPAGISIVDFQGLYAKYTLHKKDSYALMNVANDELDYEIEEDFDFMDVNIAKDKNTLDVKKMVELDKKLNLFEYFDEVRLISKCLWTDLPSEMRNYQWQSNNSKVIDMLALAEAKKLNVVLPSKQQENIKEEMEGAYRVTYGTGLYKELSKADISGAYPQSIIDFCLSPENFTDKPEENTIKLDIYSRENNEYKTTYYVRQDSTAVLPSLVRRLLSIKNELKNKLNSVAKDSEEYKKLQIAYDSRKALVNTSFGCIAMPFFRLYNNSNAESITFLIRDLLHFVEKKLTQIGKIIQYVDTDSFFYQGKEDITDQLNEWAVEWAMDKYNNSKIDIVFDYEGFFSTIFIQALCRYRGRLETAKGQKIETKGIQMKRKDAGKWVKNWQEKLYDKILDGINKEQIIQFIEDSILDMKNSDIRDISLPVKINKKIDDYKTTPKWLKPLEETKKLVPDFDKTIGDRFYIIYCKSVEKLALGNKYYKHIKKDDVDWQQMVEKNIFNLLVPIFKGLHYEEDLLKLAEKHDIILNSQYRNKLLENCTNCEELKDYYSARNAKKRMKKEKSQPIETKQVKKRKKKSKP